MTRPPPLPRRPFMEASMTELTILHGFRTLQLSKGKNTLIEEADYEAVGVFKWHYRGTLSRGNGYATRNVAAGVGRQTPVRLHKVLLGAGRDSRVDHRNGDPLDNRRCNLRTATALENGRNIHKAIGRSRFKGVSWNIQRRHWRAVIRVDGRKIYLGSSRTEEGAARLYDDAASRHFGEFACTNTDIHGSY